ncbi:MAG: hypothetical protein HY925_02345 [Elusimicrobia bacterium]|nr:hypothetical protein [Elusimicrobiota bacterium]
MRSLRNILVDRRGEGPPAELLWIVLGVVAFPPALMAIGVAVGVIEHVKAKRRGLPAPTVNRSAGFWIGTTGLALTLLGLFLFRTLS